jgi:hypothetical protein
MQIGQDVHMIDDPLEAMPYTWDPILSHGVQESKPPYQGQVRNLSTRL